MYSVSISKWFSALLMLCVLSVPSLSRAQVVEAAVLVLTGKEILDTAEVKVNQKLAEVENLGNGLVSQSIAGLNVAIQGARVNGEALLSKSLKAMSEAERSAFLAIRDATSKLDELGDKAYRLEEVANVDALALLGGIPLIKDATFISSVRGLSVMNGREEHRVTIIGSGLGPGADGVVAGVQVAHAGTLLMPTRVDMSAHNTAVMYFSTKAFEPHFKPDEVVTLPLEIKLTVTRSRLGGLWKQKKEVSSTLPFTLYPELLGRATVTAEVPVFEWVRTGSDIAKWRMRDCGGGRCGGGGVVEERFATPPAEGNTPVVGYRRVVNARCACGVPWFAPQACEYSSPVSCEVIANGTQVRIAWQVTGIWGTRSAAWDIETYLRTGVTSLVQSFDVQFGKSLSFCVPAAVDYYSIVVKTLTKETLTLTPQASASGRLEYIGKFSCNASDQRFEYRVVAPS